VSDTASSSAAGVTWNLGHLFEGPDDPRLQEELDICDEEARAFADQYRGTVNVAQGPTPELLRTALERLEALQERMVAIGGYAQLLYAADTTQAAHRSLVQQVEQRMVQLRNQLLFFDLEWLALDDAVAAPLIEHPALEPYRHYLQSERRYKPHTLSEPEERIINEKNQTGISAWTKLFTELTSALEFAFEAPDGSGTQKLNMSQVLVLLRDADRAVRQRAYETLYQTLGTQRQTLAFIYDTRFNDHLVSNRLRGYDAPIAPRNLGNEIDDAVVETMMTVTEANYPIAHRYFTLKARLLGLPKLELYDQYAPIGETKETMAYAEAQQVILDAFGRFAPLFQEIAGRFFNEGWIDAELRQGKRGGAFCAGLTPKLHPYVLCNYTDDMRDVMTVAHELGHGIHDVLASKQTLFNYYPTLPVAETASVFGEMLVFDYLLERTPDPRARLALLCGKIEDGFATVFRQNAMTRFEQLVYDRRQKEGRLADDQIGATWLEANAPYYGDSVTMTEGYGLGWSYIPHFINTPFYCYAYVFGELLVRALYRMYREEGASFIPRYIDLLAAGGSAAPADLLATMGADIADAAFWQRGFDELARLVDSAEALAAELGG
jgi:oligoendopeptidase F